jgi:hypothetical protein
MKRIMLALALLAGFAGAVQARSGARGYGSGNYGLGSNSESTQVGGYTRRDGTYVHPYQRTKANNTESDNYGTRGNYNPWNGKTGTKSWDDNN